MSLDLPLAIEFFDTPDKVETTFAFLAGLVGKEHVISWAANSYI